MKDLSLLGVANLRGNLLQSFPRHADTLNISAKLLLGLNPWKCSCNNSWMIQWLQSLSSQILLDPGDIICRYPAKMYGRNVLKSNENDFCVDAVPRNWIIAFSVVAAFVALLLVLVLIGVIFYKLRENFLQKMEVSSVRPRRMCRRRHGLRCVPLLQLGRRRSTCTSHS